MLARQLRERDEAPPIVKTRAAHDGQQRGLHCANRKVTGHLPSDLSGIGVQERRHRAGVGLQSATEPLPAAGVLQTHQRLETTRALTPDPA